MLTHHNFKIPVWPHVIESTEEDLRKVRLLLYRLSERSDDLATKISDYEPEKQEELLKEAAGFLYEIRDIFHFVTDSLGSEEYFLERIRCEEVDKIVSKLPPPESKGTLSA